MNKLERIGLTFILVILAFASIRNINVQGSIENMKTFFDSKIPGIIIQINATAETQPNQNITVNLTMNPVEDVNMKYFNFTVFGFLSGTYKTIIYNTTVNSFPFNDTFPIPEQVWGITCGEITLTYDVIYVTQQGNVQTKTTITYENLTVGFDMTCVRNVYLETVEEQLGNLTSTFEQLNRTFWNYFNKNLTPENLNETLQGLKGSSNELGNTRMTVGILAVITVFFVAATLFLAMRKPKESW